MQYAQTEKHFFAVLGWHAGTGYKLYLTDKRRTGNTNLKFTRNYLQTTWQEYMQIKMLILQEKFFIFLIQQLNKSTWPHCHDVIEAASVNNISQQYVILIGLKYSSASDALFWVIYICICTSCCGERWKINISLSIRRSFTHIISTMFKVSSQKIQDLQAKLYFVLIIEVELDLWIRKSGCL